MSRKPFRVLVDNHTHAGVALKKDDVVQLRPEVGQRHPSIFAPVDADGAGSAAEAAATSPQE